MRLAEAALPRLAPAVRRFDYDRAAQAVGIVHLGIGAFHRAHQAWYTDRALSAGDRDWAICGVSLRSPEVAAQLNPQDGLYTVAERSSTGTGYGLVGAVRNVLVAGQERERVVEQIASAAVKIISLTVTEKGYCRTAEGRLDFTLAGETSLYGLIGEALKRRRDAGLPGLTLLSCDNLADNGRQLRRLMAEYLDRFSSDLRSWFEAECACPSTMVDRIVPAVTGSDRAGVAAAIGLEDRATVLTEPFSQWVIEDCFVQGRPRWDKVGVQLVEDVAPYEMAKLRMLNGAHSALAYIGLLRGHEFVHQAVTDSFIRKIVQRLMLEEALPSVRPAPGQDLAGYAHRLLERFANPALAHRLIQIAMDGSQKIPQRWFGTLADGQKAGRSCPSVLRAVAAWMLHIRGDNGPVDDPMAAELRAVWGQGDPSSALGGLFGEAGLLSTIWVPDEGQKAFLIRSLGEFER